MTKTTDTELALKVKVPPYPAVLGQPYRVEVELINQSTGQVRVNRRMAPGYRDHLSRELYVELWEAGTDRPAKVHEMDYDRDFAGQEDFVYLEPGARLETHFDLLEWYTPESLGDFNLRIYYQADEPLASAPLDTFQGIAASEPVEISIRPGKTGTGQEYQG